MKPFIPLFTLLLSFFLSVQMQAQSLYQDARTLVAASRVLERSGYNLQDSASVEAFSTMMAILNEYDNPIGLDSFSNSRLAKVPFRYLENPSIPDLLQLDSLNGLLDTVNTGFVRQFRWHADSLQDAPRRKMVELLRGDYGDSPAEYLSVSRALRRYSVPPVESLQTLEQMAGQSNQNVRDGIVNPQALIQGLFQFVLRKAQEEVVVNFMERFLKKEVVSYGDLFPTVVEQFNTPGFSYSHSFIGRVREAFYEDLQLMSVRLPTILLNEGRFQKLQEEPLVYNLLAVYSIVGMAQNEVSLDEIMPITHRNLFENYQETEKKLNFILADSLTRSPHYGELLRRAQNSIDLIKNIYLDLEQGEYEITSGVDSILQESPGIPAPDFSYLLKPAYNLDVIMGSDTTTDFRLNLLPSLLAGHLDTAYVLKFRSVDAYDKFFGTDRTPEQWRAAGLDIARRLSGTWYSELSIARIFRNWTSDLTAYRQEYDRWSREQDPQKLTEAMKKLEKDRLALSEVIGQTKTFWEPALEGNQGLAFDMLEAIISGTLDPNDIQVRIAQRKYGKEGFLANNRRKLLDVEQRLVQLNDKIGEANPGPQTGNPLQSYLFNKTSHNPYTEVHQKIDLLEENLDSLDALLVRLDQELAPREVKLMKNARPLLWLTETLTHLFYCLRSADPVEKWITKAELDTINNDRQLRNAYLGLMYQRMSQVQESTAVVNPEGLAQLVQSTVGDLPLVLLPPPPDLAPKGADMRFFNSASFLVNTLNRLLEIPLLTDPANPRLVRPLREINPNLQNVGEISKMVLDLTYYLNVADHRHAMSSFLRLFLRVENFEKESKSVHNFLQEYGFFIADMVDAQNSMEIESLLNGISASPGSSRLKRNEDLTVGLNAYLGVNYGMEHWSSTNPDVDEKFSNLAPTMPLGVALSWRIGKASKHPQSFSAFLSFIDLGSILTYRAGGLDIGRDKITFKNMLKPGIQLHWNLNKTPFYVGAGAQTGPVYRESNGGDEISLRSTRLFLSFGVDVPIKTFFVK